MVVIPQSWRKEFFASYYHKEPYAVLRRSRCNQPYPLIPFQNANNENQLSEMRKRIQRGRRFVAAHWGKIPAGTQRQNFRNGKVVWCFAPQLRLLARQFCLTRSCLCFRLSNRELAPFEPGVWSGKVVVETIPSPGSCGRPPVESLSLRRFELDTWSGIPPTLSFAWDTPGADFCNKIRLSPFTHDREISCKDAKLPSSQVRKESLNIFADLAVLRLCVKQRHERWRAWFARKTAGFKARTEDSGRIKGRGIFSRRIVSRSRGRVAGDESKVISILFMERIPKSLWVLCITLCVLLCFKYFNTKVLTKSTKALHHVSFLLLRTPFQLGFCQKLLVMTD